MTDQELRRLSRLELLQLLLEQTRQTEQLREELARAQEKLDARQIQLQKAGSIAAAAVEISGVLQAAQQAADLYLESVKHMVRESGSILPDWRAGDAPDQ